MASRAALSKGEMEVARVLSDLKKATVRESTRNRALGPAAQWAR